MLGGSVPILRRTGLHGDFGADIALLQLDVDHAGDGIGAVQRRSAVLEHLDGVDRIERNGAHVDEAALTIVAQRIGHHALAVDQRERVAHRQAAQRDAGGAGGECLAEALVESSRTVGREVAQHVGDFGVARILQVLRGDDLNRSRRFGVGSLDQRAGDDDFLQLGRWAGIRRLLSERGGTGEGRAQSDRAGGDAQRSLEPALPPRTRRKLLDG